MNRLPKRRPSPFSETRPLRESSILRAAEKTPETPFVFPASCFTSPAATRRAAERLRFAVKAYNRFRSEKICRAGASPPRAVLFPSARLFVFAARPEFAFFPNGNAGQKRHRQQKRGRRGRRARDRFCLRCPAGREGTEERRTEESQCAERRGDAAPLRRRAAGNRRIRGW